MNRFILILTGLLFIGKINSFAQDPVFTQPYMSQVYLNPAATGSGEYDLRISGIIRRQWLTIPSDFTYSVFSIDKFIPKLSSGLGIMETNSSEGYLKKNGVYATYAYTYCPGGDPPKWFLTGAMQWGRVQRRVDYSDLLFSDQIGVDGVIPGRQTEADLPINSGKWYRDVSTGLFFNRIWLDMNDDQKNRLLVGISAKHINTPDESYTATNDKPESPVPVLWSINFLFSGRIGGNWSYNFMGNASKQQNNKLLQLGFEVREDKIDLGVGIWFRAADYTNPETVGLSLSFNLANKDQNSYKLKAGISHDMPVGNKKFSKNGGSSELSFVWDQRTYPSKDDNPCKPNIGEGLQCPRF